MAQKTSTLFSTGFRIFYVPRPKLVNICTRFSNMFSLPQTWSVLIYSFYQLQNEYRQLNLFNLKLLGSSNHWMIINMFIIFPFYYEVRLLIFYKYNFRFVPYYICSHVVKLKLSSWVSLGKLTCFTNVQIKALAVKIRN